jgi:MYXO-CTERM domain-containing protein
MRFGILLATLATSTALALPCHAYSTRVHIMLANRIHDALAASGNGSIPLWQGGNAVILSPDDAAAILEEPEAFRAGAIGPDNMMFPGMTDPSHAITLRPFEQCERLYQLAVLPKERAYAMGCFLHGSTDAVAHHYVNYMTGETFTLNPISSGRQFGFRNVVRHMLAEDLIQSAAAASDPAAFSGEAMSHEIPKGFVLRAYFDPESPVYELLGHHARTKFEEARAADPDATLLEIIPSLDVAPADQLVLLPIYIEELQLLRQSFRATFVAALEELQDWDTPDGAVLLVMPGADGVLGTKDDETDCSLSCPTLYIEYFIYAGLLEPRYDAGGNELPPAWDKVSDKLGADLAELVPALVDVTANVSSRLNTGLDEQGGGLEDLDTAAIQSDFAPILDWTDEITTVDVQAIEAAVSPEWLVEMDLLFQGVGIDVDIAAQIEALLEPALAPIREGIRARVIDETTRLLEDLRDEYVTFDDEIRAEYAARHAAAMPAGVEGESPLDHFFDTGLYGHSFNITAAALANHAAVLPIGQDAVGHGPASFDCSHTQSWMQAGVCPHLQPLVFPFGLEVSGALSLRKDGVDHPSPLAENAPIECHDGSLSEFTSTPAVETCGLVSLAQLSQDPIGSVSRGYPPAFAPTPVECANIEVPGLPPPGSQSGVGGEGAAAAPPPAPRGCGECHAGTNTAPGGAWWLLGAALFVCRRRRLPMLRALLLASALLLGLGCDEDLAGPGGGAGQGGSSSGVGGGATGTAIASTGSTMPNDDLLLKAIDGRWTAVLNRDGRERAYELWFDSENLRWAEVRNPFGPARSVRAGEFVVDDGTVQAVDDDSGEVLTWQISVVEDQLLLDHDDMRETFEQGPWPEPTAGLTADVRVFAATGPVADAYCTANSATCDIDYDALFAFARGTEGSDLGSDRVAGATLLSWYNVPNFAVTDVTGFDFETLGGTALSDQYNFVVRYAGWIDHPGGTLSLREQDDDVGELSLTDYGGVWAFVGDDVGSGGFDQLFLGVNAFIGCSDGSDNEPSVDLPAGLIPIEIIMIRCNSDGPPVDVEASIAGGAWLYVGDQPARPDTSDTLFPPPF